MYWRIEQFFYSYEKKSARDVLLCDPKFSKRFIIHNADIKTQLGGVISQNGKPIAFYPRKLTHAQLNYTSTEIELLSIVETSKLFHTIPLVNHITVYMDHKNLTFENFKTERVLRWRLMLE